MYENENWLPRAFLVHEAQQLPDQAAVLHAISENTDLGQTAYIGASDDDLFHGLNRNARTYSKATVEIVHRSANRTEVKVETENPGLLILSKTWMPGWRAEVDGSSASVHRIDYALLGVEVPAGEHEVRFRYSPIEWQVGWRVTVGSLLAAALALIVDLAWRKSTTRSPRG